MCFTSHTILMTWESSISIRLLLTLPCIIPRQLIHTWQGTNLHSLPVNMWFLGRLPFKKNSEKNGCRAKWAVTLVLVLASQSIKKWKGFIIMTAHGAAPWLGANSITLWSSHIKKDEMNLLVLSQYSQKHSTWTQETVSTGWDAKCLYCSQLYRNQPHAARCFFLCVCFWHFR